MMERLEVVQFPGFPTGDPFKDTLIPYKDTFELTFGRGTHPVLANCLPCMKLWVKIGACGTTGRIVGLINKEHRFNSMADFQPIDTVSFEQDGETVEERILNIANSMSEDRMSDTKVFLPSPPLFSTETMPRSLADFHFSSARQSDKTRLSRQGIPWFCHYADQVPTSPSEEAIDKARLVPDEARQELNDILKQRPIISKLAVYCMASNALRHHLRALLPSVCYYFVNGPWRNTWIRYGLDPRQSPEHRRFQVLECRNMYTQSRSAASQKKFRGKRGGMQQVKRLPSSSSADTNVPPNGYLFDGVTLNGNFFMYQLCDLVYRETHDIVEDPSLVSTQANEKEGWYKDGTLSRLREIVKRRWIHLKKSATPSYADFEREQADLEDILFSSSMLSQSVIDSFDSSMFANILTGGGDGISSDADEFFIFDE